VRYEEELEVGRKKGREMNRGEGKREREEEESEEERI
jgi:hypothetical protein